MRRSHALLLPALLTLLLGAAPAAAAPAAKRGTLTADTTIRWRGNAGIRLATNGGGALPRDAMSLFLVRGTFAFVVMLDDPQPPECRDGREVVHCHSFALLKVPGLDVPYDVRPGGEFQDFSSRPPTIVGRHLDVYLFTDGEAMLRLRPERGGYRGRSGYVAGGKVRGLARRLPSTCGTLCHKSAATEFAAGGATFDYGRRPGHVLTISVTNTPYKGDRVPSNHPQIETSCFYPNPFEPTASPEPGDHPYGCHLRPTDGENPQYPVAEVVSAVDFGSGAATMWRAGDRRGKVYAGFYAGYAWVEPTYNHGHAVWFNYGIS